MIAEIMGLLLICMAVGAGFGVAAIVAYLGFSLVAKPFDWLERRFFPDKDSDK
jgi:hypothetical protein